MASPQHGVGAFFVFNSDDAPCPGHRGLSKVLPSNVAGRRQGKHHVAALGSSWNDTAERPFRQQQARGSLADAFHPEPFGLEHGKHRPKQSVISALGRRHDLRKVFQGGEVGPQRCKVRAADHASEADSFTIPVPQRLDASPELDKPNLLSRMVIQGGVGDAAQTDHEIGAP